MKKSNCGEKEEMGGINGITQLVAECGAQRRCKFGKDKDGGY